MSDTEIPLQTTPHDEAVLDVRLDAAGHLYNACVLALGKIIKTGKLSYKAFQKNFGRSVAVRAPGKFVELPTGKAEDAGGLLESQNTRITKLSQTCIQWQRREDASQTALPHMFLRCRKHEGTSFLAQLARRCGNRILDICRAKAAWPAAKPLLRRRVDATRNGRSRAYARLKRQSCLPVEDGSTFIEVVDVVAERRAPQKDAGFAVSPPGF